LAEDKVDRLEARTALLLPEAVELDAQREAVAAAGPVAQPEAEAEVVAAEPVAQQEAAVVVAEPVAQPEAAVVVAEPVAQPEAAVVVAEPVAQQQAVVAVAEPVAQPEAAVVAAEPVAQQQAAAVTQPGVRPLAASVELAETAAVRFWIREASILVRAPE
jgi:hypothetical protein